MTPWAKLNTRDALKINTKPSAISEYMMPALNPWMSSCTNRSGRSPTSTNGW